MFNTNMQRQPVRFTSVRDSLAGDSSLYCGPVSGALFIPPVPSVVLIWNFPSGNDSEKNNSTTAASLTGGWPQHPPRQSNWCRQTEDCRADRAALQNPATTWPNPFFLASRLISDSHRSPIKPTTPIVTLNPSTHSRLDACRLTSIRTELSAKCQPQPATQAAAHDGSDSAHPRLPWDSAEESSSDGPTVVQTYKP